MDVAISADPHWPPPVLGSGGFLPLREVVPEPSGTRIDGSASRLDKDRNLGLAFPEKLTGDNLKS